MARSRSVKIELDLKERNARRKLQQLAGDVGDVEDELGEVESAGKAMARAIERSADDMIAEIDATKRAVDAMDTAFGDVDMDSVSVVADLKRVGLTAEQVEENADELARALRRSEDVKLHAANQGFSDLGDAVTSVSENSQRANDVTRGFLGNVAGDAVQTAVPIGGLGESVGQMVEGLAEGEVGMKNLVSAGLGMAGIGAAAFAINGYMKAIERRKAFRRESIQAYLDALTDADDELGAINQKLREQETFRIRGAEGYDQVLLESFVKLGLTVDNTTLLIQKGEEAIDRWAEASIRAGKDSTAVQLAAFYMREEVDLLGDSMDRAALENAYFVESTDEAAAATEDATDAVVDHKSALEDAREAIREEAEALRDSASALEEQITARMALVDSNFALRDAEREWQEQLEDSQKELRKTEAGSADYQEVLDSTAESALKLAEAEVRRERDMAAAEGRTLSNQRSLDLMNESLLNSAAAAEGPFRASIIKMIGTINDIPEAKVTEIQAAIDRGDIAEAERILNDTSRSRRAAITADVSTADANARLNWLFRNRSIRVGISADPRFNSAFAKGTQYAPGGSALVGEEGPEIVDLPMGSKVTPAGKTAARMREGSGGGTTNVTIHQHLPPGTRPIDVAQASRRYGRIQGNL